MHELKKVDDEVFLDRDGHTFETLVNYLRNDRKVFPEFTDKNAENHFYKELHYWGIDQQYRGWQEQYLKRLDRSVYPGEQDHLSRSKSPRHNRTQVYQKPSAYFNPKTHQKETTYINPVANVTTTPAYYEPEESVTVQNELPSYMMNNSVGNIGNSFYEPEEDDMPGVALKAVKDKWSELGPLKLEDII